jgi:exonuclease III
MGKSLDDTHLIIFHQNIRGLRKKTNELLCHLSRQLSHILCFTEHHLTLHEIQSVYIDKFTCGAYYCRKQLRKGGVCVCIYVNNNIISSCLNLEAYCSNGVIEVCCVKFKFRGKKFYILTVYGSPSGNFTNFISQLEKIVHSFFNYKNSLIICGDMNVNYLEDSRRVR